MKPCFLVLFAINQGDFRESRPDHSRANLTKPWSAWSRSVEQLEQLAGEQGDNAKHQVQPDFLGSPHYDVAAPKLFLQAAVEALRHRPFLVPWCSGPATGVAEYDRRRACKVKKD